MIVKMELEMLGFPNAGASTQAIPAKTTTAARPKRTIVDCEAFGNTYFFSRSKVKIEEAALSIAASELITAPNSAANTKPNSPTFCGSIPNN